MIQLMFYIIHTTADHFRGTTKIVELGDSRE